MAVLWREAAGTQVAGGRVLNLAKASKPFVSEPEVLQVTASRAQVWKPALLGLSGVPVQVRPKVPSPNLVSSASLGQIGRAHV